jgi:SP family xylose:H+ symportor-like MFS transporter
MFASELVPVSIFLALLYFVPDTPRSLVSHNKEVEALEILKKVNGESEAQSILSDIKNTLVVKTNSALTYGWGLVIMGFYFLFSNNLLVLT